MMVTKRLTLLLYVLKFALLLGSEMYMLYCNGHEKQKKLFLPCCCRPKTVKEFQHVALMTYVHAVLVW